MPSLSTDVSDATFLSFFQNRQPKAKNGEMTPHHHDRPSEHDQHVKQRWNAKWFINNPDKTTPKTGKHEPPLAIHGLTDFDGGGTEGEKRKREAFQRCK